ncbi:Integral membrane protein TerC [Rippkaea orientalis PCC 8801]|uniref:Integral membrane protein TerC n=1 Tax=Rippkaea orientalis (strain PCC 8801 / RF-1) TaxID=41431 RepID=B7JWJ0_RIPO1|nr:DUF475 domain-containing protein [Rippkaea orientalis]ACK68331.1 Integral membrane protein TerC [Rippkaea orientalis PCC 8801]
MFEALISPLFSSDGFAILLALVTLETVLSADNAVALAALAGEVKPIKKQRLVLNWGLALAFILRIILLLSATWVMQFWQFEVAGGLYLIWLAGKHFWPYLTNENPEDSLGSQSSNNGYSTGRIILLIALTDLAFSLDSVTAAVALSDQMGLVLLGCTLGIITLRCLASLFVRWLTEFSYLADAAYLTILGVGLRLLGKVIIPDLIPPQWVMLAFIVILFTWGFSRRVTPEIPQPSQIWLTSLRSNPSKLTNLRD